MGLYDFTFYDLIARNAGCFGDRPAWFEVDAGKSITFLEVKGMIDRLAFGLQTIGIKKGDRVGILGKNSLEYFLLYGAAAALGAILLPVNWRLSAEEIKYNLNDCAPEVLFLDTEFQDLVKELKSDLSSVKSYYTFKDQNDIFLGFNDLMNKTGQFEAEDVSDNDGFVIIHTAAVGGRPRGALLSHGNLLCAGLHLNYCFHLTEKDVHLNFLPLFHVGGLFMVISSFIAGALNVNMSNFDAEKAVELIETKKVTLFFDFSPILASIL
jgi:acyl-CoA synthetase (AMP-forming)/AMP-acid ligase II